ncbi:hypothetical protein Vau01_075960 [Virgisporangium aurantiacum]|uniref:Uncharacterized protein n=1 Tax=Virgisporangium aurantiacum TaxID=175570 RepID=A0A8J3ZEA1_9ACTN|nr:hypothetical protein Vau01_075960 [Virgisporangium aurantiacum]
MFGAHPPQLRGQQVEHLVPVEFDELVAARRSVGPGPWSSQPRRTAGRATRVGCRNPSTTLPSNGDGAGSLGCGTTASRPSGSTRTPKAPQWEVVGMTVMPQPIPDSSSAPPVRSFRRASLVGDKGRLRQTFVSRNPGSDRHPVTESGWMS